MDPNLHIKHTLKDPLPLFCQANGFKPQYSREQHTWLLMYNITYSLGIPKWPIICFLKRIFKSSVLIYSRSRPYNNYMVYNINSMVFTLQKICYDNHYQVWAAANYCASYFCQNSISLLKYLHFLLRIFLIDFFSKKWRLQNDILNMHVQ